MSEGTLTPHSTRPRSLPGRVVRFAVVGGSGVIVNQGLLMLLHGALHWPLLASSALAVECSIISNFLGNSLWTWQVDFHNDLSRWLRKGLAYHAGVAASALLGNVLLLMLLVKMFAVDYRIANLTGIAVGSTFNYLINDLLVFRRASSRQADHGA